MPCLPEPGLHVTFGSNRRMASSAIARLYLGFIIKDGKVLAQQFQVPAGRHCGHIASDYLLDVADEPPPPRGRRHLPRRLGELRAAAPGRRDGLPG